MIRFSELQMFIDTEKNEIIAESPIKYFMGAPCTLLGKSECDVKHLDYLFVHSFNPSELEEGIKIEHTDLEYLTYSKPTQDLSCKRWSAIAFNRDENKIVSYKEWSVWASDRDIKKRWIENLQNKFSNIHRIT